MGYVLWSERVERDAAAYFQAAAVSRALGNDVPLVSLAEARADWWARVCEEPTVERMSTEELTLRTALGLVKR